MNLSKIIASIFGIGYIRKGGGTVAAAFAVLVWWLLFRNDTAVTWPVVLTIAVTTIGVVVGNIVEADWGKDSYRVVIDEVSGMFVTVLFVEPDWKWLIAGFVLFRFFDIVKPLYIRRAEAWKGGMGVMMDDVLAGVYANIVLQVIITLYFQFR